MGRLQVASAARTWRRAARPAVVLDRQQIGRGYLKTKLLCINRRSKHYAIPKLLFREPLPANATLPVECLWCDKLFLDNCDLKFHLARAHL